MSHSRRLTAVLAAVAPLWAVLAVVVATPAQADVQPPHDPATYYASAAGLSGAALQDQLHTIISAGTTALSYTPGVWDALKLLDEDPNDPTKIIDFYSGDPILKTNTCNPCTDANSWNREHTFPQSHGGFGTTAGAGTDLFHMRPLRENTNSSRGNKDFDNGGAASVPGCSVCHATSNTFEPRAAIKGDLARGLMYMAVRYELGEGNSSGDLELTETVPSSNPFIGRLSTLVTWSQADPPDDTERTRNNLIDSNYQHNRNPFIDHPEWVCSIWGSSVPPATCAVTNQAPVPGTMSKTIAENSGATTIPLVATDADGDPLTWTLNAAAPAQHGTASIIGSAPSFSLSYTPSAGYSGTDQVGVKVDDGHGHVVPATVTITIVAVNHQPTVQDIGPVQVPKDNSKQITLLGNDVDPGDVLTYSVVVQPARGSVTINGDVATYSSASFSGDDSFTYRATDSSNAQSPTGEVAVTVGNSPNAPVATTVSATTNEDTPKTFDLTATDADGDQLTYIITSQPTKGSFTRTGKSVTYTPDPNTNGNDSFAWSVTDGTSTASSTASITITPVDDPPFATGSSTSTLEDTVKVINLAGTDADGQTLTFAKDSDPFHGTVSMTTGGQATYTPAANYHGPDSFTFTVSDGNTTSEPATVTIAVGSVNDVPVATAASTSTPEDTAKVVTLTGTDADPEDTLTFAKTTDPAHGTVTITAAGSATYSPAANYHGPDSFAFRVNDGTSNSAPVAVSITVDSVNDTPTATAASATTNEDTATVIDLAGADIDGDTLTFAKASDPAHGTVSVTPTGAATYTPAAGYHGPDSFTFTVSDGTLTSSAATVSVTVDGVNDPPSVADAALSTTAGTPVTATLTTSDPDGDTVTITSATTPAHGSVTFSGADVTYTPATRSGTETFTVTVSDGHGGQDTAQVDVDITARSATVSLVTPAATRGKPVTTTITVAGPAGPRPTGQVTVKNGATTLGTVTLGVGGTATLTWTPTTAGTAQLVATYAGDGLFDPASSTATWRPAPRSPSVLTFSGSIKKGKPGKIKIAITSVAGSAASGKITIKVGTRKFRATLKNGVATFKLPATTQAKLKVKATYAGDGQYAAGSGKKTYRTT